MRKPSVKAARSRAKAEIYSVLSEDLRISAERMDGILARHGVRRSPEELQRAYRLSVGQRFIAEVRDGDEARKWLICI